MDPALGAYLQQVAAGLARALGPALAGLYLHGSAALGGWSAGRSDVDLLGVVARPLGRRAKQVVAARLLHPALVCPAAGGLEFSLVTAAVAADPPRRPPFELHVSTAPEDARHHLGGPGAVDPDLLLYFAVCRRAGVAVRGAPPAEVFAEPPRAWLLAQAAEELRWALQHRGFTYRVLTACRAWRLLEDGELDSKLDGGEWARRRLATPALVDAAMAAQRGLAPAPAAPADLAAADRFAAMVLNRFPEADR
jgi:streptomycin 3"-adenylyltransferase